ncbi:P-loop NTPase fold protein [Sunxiuqinia elliptica]|uniref:AAA ATPase-like protein n=1 Tax=Sunxiuqinia elliptica TaxID=655355 RepID=A0A1I2L333_9BACT|nr:P-loop NTPase fold protein [Sunxiuqinia elliptica]SFF73732.1 hypothetical protein SAMN05216283_11486 [Sunxiuqinia elliptica]
MPSKMWESLGFRENPYNTKPLNISKQDVELLMGRENEQIDFLTAIESEEQGIFVLSGVPGVGKTSFLNVQQFLLESGEADFGPRLLAARQLCPIQQYDEPKFIAQRCIQSFCKSIEEYCNITNKSVPSETSKVSAWIHQNKPATINFGLSYLGTGVTAGREVHLPSVQSTTFETLAEIIETLSLEVKNKLNFEGSFIVLDNIENLQDDELSQCLTTFRDTLFTIPNIWWILIGQSGLSSLIQSTNPKVFQRLSAGIELKPISVENLIKAVDIRVKTFHETKNNGSSLITKKVYLKLFESSNGEIRFVFKYCQNICIKLVQLIRKELVEKNQKMTVESFNRLMGQHLIKNQIDDDFSHTCLNVIVREEFEGYYHSTEEKQILKRIGELGKVNSKDFKEFSEFGIKTMQDFTQNVLIKFREQQLLLRRQEGKKITYELRGISVFAMEYGLLNE